MAESRSLDSETARNDQIVLSYDGSGNIEYVGNARAGAATSDSLWRIKKLAYDGSNNILSVKWASGSPAYAFIWDSRTSFIYS